MPSSSWVTSSSTESSPKFLGCDIATDDEGTVTMCMTSYLPNISEVQLGIQRKLEPDSPATSSELYDYKYIAGTLLYLGQAVLPQAYLLASKLLQRLGKLVVSDVTDSIPMLREPKSLSPMVSFRCLQSIESSTI